ncbi:MAG: MarR family winged helix-turn-helix transcriptional regulator [Kiritimatiellia bacterium]
MNSNLSGTTGAQLFLSLWRTSRAVMRVDQASIAALGFNSLSDFAVLEVLLHKGPLPVNTIGEKVLLTSGSITSAVQRLEKQGQVRREKGGKDARVVLVHLTPRGKTLIEKAYARHAQDLDDIFTDLGGEERKQFLQLMKKVRSRAVSLNDQRSAK